MPCIIHKNYTLCIKPTSQEHDGSESFGVMRVQTPAYSLVSLMDIHCLREASVEYENNKETFDMLLRLIVILSCYTQAMID